MNKPLRAKYTTRQPDVKTVKNAGPFICFVATSTEEKLAHYNAIAHAENIPILYLSLNTILEAFLAAPEDTGDMIENGYQKLRAIKDSRDVPTQSGLSKDHQGYLLQVWSGLQSQQHPVYGRRQHL